MAASSDVESCVGDTTVQRRQWLLGAATTRGAGVLQDGAIFCYEGAMGFLLDRGASTDAATGTGTAAGGDRDGERIQQRGTRGEEVQVRGLVAGDRSGWGEDAVKKKRKKSTRGKGARGTDLTAQARVSDGWALTGPTIGPVRRRRSLPFFIFSPI